jgi:predicted DCC family thiol-disulfide oxidoreductase YuxK
MQGQSEDNPVLLYDGVCGFCNKAVQTILRHDRHGRMRFAALQSDYGKSIVTRHPELQNVDSLIYVENPSTTAERVFVRSMGALRVAAYLGGAWKLLLIFRIVPRPVRDFFYDLFARYRYKLFGKHDMCLLPSPDVRARFLDNA